MSAQFRHRTQPHTLQRARALRSSMTPPEAKLWARLRNRQLGGFKFRRQHPIGQYVADFCCAQTRLVVELDGDSHAETEEYDKKRTTWLTEQGYQEIRFWNREVVQDLDAVLQNILDVCLNSKPSP